MSERTTLNRFRLQMIVYRTSSFIQQVLLFLFRIGYITGAGIALYHYNENPVVTSIIAALCMFFLLLSGNDEVIVYSHSFEFRQGSLLKVFKKQLRVKLGDIKTLNIEGAYSTADELYNPTITTNRKLNRLKIQLVDGKITTIETTIYINKLKKAILETEKLLQVEHK